MKKSAIAALLFITLATLSGCGMMIGQMMVAGTGVNEFKTVKGDISLLRRGGNLLVLAPFSVKNRAYEPARGDFAARFSSELSLLGTFNTAFSFVEKPELLEKRSAELAAMGPEEVKKALGLDLAPDYLLRGTIERSDTVVAPMHGVILEGAFTLDFTDLKTGKDIVVYAEVKELYGHAIPAVAAQLDSNIK